MDCDNCKKKSVPEIVSRYFFEETVARMDIAHRRVWILCIVLAVMLVASWVGFFIYESQFEDTYITHTQEVDQQADGNGNNTFVGGDNYGDETESQENHNDQDTEA